MFAIVGIAASAAISGTGFGYDYGPGADGFNELGLHEGIQVSIVFCVTAVDVVD